MTAAFDEFVRQYKMTGSEKADGYSKNAFIGLDEREKEEVFTLLLNELPFSAEWLVFVNREKAIAVMKEEEPKLRKDAFAHTYMIQEELIRHTGELVYQHHMIDDYPNYTKRLKPRVVSAVGRTPQNNETVSFFKRVILTEVNEDAVARAADELVSSLKVPCATTEEKNECRRITQELRDDNNDVKLRALKRIARYEAN